MDYRVLLYYKYTPLENPEQFAKEHLAFCNSLNLKGRILIASEGINGTLSGTIADTDAYMKAMLADERFKDTYFKIDEAQEMAFHKMFVRPRKELVSLNLEEDVNPLELTGKYLEPKEFKEALLDENTVVIDARNDYEYDLGHFRGAVRPDIRNFRELPQWIRENKEQFMDKKIVTYCTGGIRCEKFSGWMLKKDLKMFHNFMAGLLYMEKILKYRVNYGMEKCTFSMNASVWKSIMSIKKSSVKTGLMEHLANVISTVLTRSVINKF